VTLCKKYQPEYDDKQGQHNFFYIWSTTWPDALLSYVQVRWFWAHLDPCRNILSGISRGAPWFGACGGRQCQVDVASKKRHSATSRHRVRHSATRSHIITSIWAVSIVISWHSAAQRRRRRLSFQQVTTQKALRIDWQGSGYVEAREESSPMFQERLSFDESACDSLLDLGKEKGWKRKGKEWEMERRLIKESQERECGWRRRKRKGSKKRKWECLSFLVISILRPWLVSDVDTTPPPPVRVCVPLCVSPAYRPI